MSQNIIQKLRQKPKGVRDNIAMSIAGVFTSLVLVVWFIGSTDKLGQVVESSKEGAGAFSTFIGHIKGEMASVADSLPDKEEFQKAASSTLQEQVSNQIESSRNSQNRATSSIEKKSIVRIGTTTASTTLSATTSAEVE